MITGTEFEFTYMDIAVLAVLAAFAVINAQKGLVGAVLRFLPTSAFLEDDLARNKICKGKLYFSAYYEKNIGWTGLWEYYTRNDAKRTEQHNRGYEGAGIYKKCTYKQ